MNEEQFLKSTPRKVGKLWETHREFNGWNIKEEKPEEKVYIDQIPFL